MENTFLKILGSAVILIISTHVSLVRQQGGQSLLRTIYGRDHVKFGGQLSTEVVMRVGYWKFKL